MKLLLKVIEIKFIMSETRKYCCCGLFSLENGSVIIGIFNLLIAMSAYIGMIHIPLEKGGTIFRFIDYHYIENIVLVDFVLSVLFYSMLIYGIWNLWSAYFQPWVMLYILKIIAVSNF